MIGWLDVGRGLVLPFVRSLEARVGKQANELLSDSGYDSVFSDNESVADERSRYNMIEVEQPD